MTIMKIIKNIPEELVVWNFLAAELKSSRFAAGSEKALKMLDLPKTLITRPDFKSVEQNQQRARILHLTRGWPNEELFTNFPNTLRWYLVDISIDELKKSYRLKSHDGMRLKERNIGNTADAISKGEVVANVDPKVIFQIRLKIEEKGDILPIILVGKDLHSKLVLIEGHSRSIAYALSSCKNARVILGLSKEITHWDYY